MEKSAGIQLELKDLDTSKRTAVIKHAVYNSIDKVGDISHKGMFTKSWSEGLPKFYFNHNKEKKPGKTLRVFEDSDGAYTEVKFSNTTLGNDVMEMIADDIIEGASYGYETIKRDYSEIKGRRIRNLREVKHPETSILNIEPAHDGAGIISLIKSIDEISEDEINNLLTWGNEHILSLKSYIEKIDNYCRKAKASDETITTLQNNLTEYKQIISEYDTAITPLAMKPVASDDEIETMLLRAKILLAS